jgi:hypothetical protein
MSFAGARILTGIMLVGAVAAAQPGIAYAQSCNGGSANAGDVQPFNPTIDYTQLAQFTLDSAGADITMLVVDDQNNVACDASAIMASHLSCNWMPVQGASYTVQVMRPAPAVADPNATAESFSLCSMGAN